MSEQQQEQPPPLYVSQQAYTAHTGHGSVGAVIGVLAVIIVLGVIAGMIGRMCSGRRIMGYGQYDVEGWMERKCSSCIDGRIGSSPARPQATTNVNSSGGSVPVAIPVEILEETKQNDHSPPQNPSETRDS